MKKLLKAEIPIHGSAVLLHLKLQHMHVALVQDFQNIAQLPRQDFQNIAQLRAEMKTERVCRNLRKMAISCAM